MSDFSPDFAALERRILAWSGKIPGWVDPHRQRALDLFGEVTPDTRRRAKIINYAEAYGSGQIGLSRTAGQYPMERTQT